MSLIPLLTDAGKKLLIAALSGSPLNFTKIKIGSGNELESPSMQNSLVDLVNPVVTVNIENIEKGSNYVNLTGVFNNSNITDGFKWTETGVFATGEDGEDVLYAYCHAGELDEYIPPNDCGKTVEIFLTVLVIVGDAENVSATVCEGLTYATTKELEEHKNNNDNPHNVTAEQVGLGIDIVTEKRTGIISENIQIQGSATVINGCYVSCPSGLLNSDKFNGIMEDADSAIAVLPVVSGQTYTIFFPGVTTVEMLKNAASLSTFKRLFRGFLVIDKAYDLNSLSVLDVAEWIENSEIKLDGYSKCNTGTSNPDLFNSGYFATFTVPDGANTVIFNAALSETAKSAKKYDFRDSFIVFEGTMSDTVEMNVDFVTRFGNLFVRDIEAANALAFMKLQVNALVEYSKSAEIPQADFCTFPSALSDDATANVYKIGNMIHGSIRITKIFSMDVEDATYYVENIFEIEEQYRPIFDVVCSAALFSESAGVFDGKLHITSQGDTHTVLYADSRTMGNINGMMVSFSYPIAATKIEDGSEVEY